jgi:hypothetical protein
VQYESKLDELRKIIHQLEFEPVLNEWVVRKAGALDFGKGLARLATTRVQYTSTGFFFEFPWDVRSDAEDLFQRWSIKKFNLKLEAGLLIKPDRNRTMIVDPATPTRDCRYYGEGDFKNGAWFFFFAAARRDGAHGNVQGGIAAGPEGAYSVILSGKDYPNLDYGDDVHYCGTALDSVQAIQLGEPTANTKSLIKSIETQNPIRLLRNSNLPADNIYQPKSGIRYDGLYTCVSQTTLDARKQLIRFRLRRMPGQDPIRYQGEARRPTVQQDEELQKFMARRTWEYPKGGTPATAASAA